MGTIDLKQKCVPCLVKQLILELALIENDPYRTKRSWKRLYTLKLGLAQEKLLGLKYFDTLNCCSQECRDYAKAIRKEQRIYGRAEIRDRKIMLSNAKRLYNKAKNTFAEIALRDGLEADSTIRAKRQLIHYSIVISQRQRRYREVVGKLAQNKLTK